MLHEMEGMAMTDAEIEDFFNFMDQGPGCGGPGGGLHSGPLAAFAAADLSDAGTPGDAGAAAPASSSDGNGSSEQQDSRMRDAPRSPGSSEDCTGGGAAAGMQIPCRPQPAHHHHPAAYAAAGAHYAQQHHQPAGLGRLPEGEAYPPAGAGAGAPAAAAVPVPMPVARAASAAELAASAGRAAPDMLRAHSAASLGSLTHPLEGLALGSPAVVAGPSMAAAAADGPAAAAAMAQAAGGAPPMVMFGAAAAHGGGHFATPFSMVSMGAFAPAGVAYMPAAALAACGSAPPGAVSLASTLDAGGDPAVGGGGMCGAQLSTSWPSAAAGGCAASAPSLSAAAAAAAAAGLSRQRSTGASKPPSSGRAGAVRSRSGSADATYHRSSGGGGNLSHSTIEKQRRDRLNSLLDELGAMVPPSDGRSDGSRRPKHVILSDAIALLSSLQERLRLGGDEIAALRQRLAAAEPGGGPAGAGGLDAACGGGGGAAGAGAGIDVPRVGGGAAGGARVKPEPSSSAEFHMLPPTPSGTSPCELLNHGMLRCASSDAELSAPGGGGGGTAAPCSLVVEQEGASLRVAVSCHDRDGLLSELVAAIKATGAAIAKASITSNGDGTARDEFELRLDETAGARLEDVRGAVLAVLCGAGGGAAGARGKRTRQ
ncbi:hypothetical protein Rsub_00116 [Raphidocelis subcapitata]|uniref:BHLH domain-containing protein n=1 Tax=Raphidocelis subcapitata TaxID=307507 RepID=A0A2V0NRE8_9CHLO|nr:hypothetical protein Rsub_00116 [Raphidocelis subcapitata]|eukprot:GBF87405.1 hypothetical protein Rsub_00116 [Raphidocelis subcapitata]